MNVNVVINGRRFKTGDAGFDYKAARRGAVIRYRHADGRVECRRVLWKLPTWPISEARFERLAAEGFKARVSR